jgi:hypothetical protein
LAETVSKQEFEKTLQGGISKNPAFLSQNNNHKFNGKSGSDSFFSKYRSNYPPNHK